MKNFGKFFLAVFVALFSSITIVNAASKCDYDEQVELNNIAANIKVSYEEAERVEESVGSGLLGDDSQTSYYYFKVHIYNLTEDNYLKVTNDINDEVKYLYYENSESSTITFDWYDLDKVTNFTFTVYSTNKTSCPNEEYRIMYLTLPRYNPYSIEMSCVGNEEYYLCQKYTTEKEDVSYETFLDKIGKYSINKSEEKTEDEKIVNDGGFKDFWKNNKLTIGIISTLILVGGVVTIVIVIKKQRSRLI